MKKTHNEIENEIWQQFCQALEDNCEDAFITENTGFYDCPCYETVMAEPYASFTVEDQLDYLGYENYSHFVRENA